MISVSILFLNLTFSLSTCCLIYVRYPLNALSLKNLYALNKWCIIYSMIKTCIGSVVVNELRWSKKWSIWTTLILISRNWILFLMLWMLALSADSDFLMMALNSRAAIAMPTIWNYVTFGIMRFFISEFKELFNISYALWVFWSAQVIRFKTLFVAHC